MIIIDSDHLPTPYGQLGIWTQPQFCAHCDKQITSIEDFGWVHDPPDHETVYRCTNVGMHTTAAYGPIDHTNGP